MISTNTIMKLVKEYAKSPEGKAEIKRVYGVDYDENFTKQKADSIIKAMKTILFKHVNTVINSIQLDDIVAGELTVEDGKAMARISFKEGSLHRESLIPEFHPEGIKDIVLLFETGYHASQSVHGLWHDKETYSRTDREPNSFLQDAVEEFNNKYKGTAIARLDGVYK